MAFLSITIALKSYVLAISEAVNSIQLWAWQWEPLAKGKGVYCEVRGPTGGGW
ncbi:MAG: hypothetical protein AAGU27_09735 [Dehalobacterium sp.]